MSGATWEEGAVIPAQLRPWEDMSPPRYSKVQLDRSLTLAWGHQTPLEWQAAMNAAWTLFILGGSGMHFPAWHEEPLLSTAHEKWIWCAQC